MVFSSLFYLYLFLPLNIIIYFCSKTKAVKNAVLLVFSLTFYAWGRIPWMLLLVLTAFLDYRNALVIEKSRGTEKAKRALILSIIVDVGIFVGFKYTGFFAQNLNVLLPFLRVPVPNINLPIGISFYTFQTLTYVIDVYRGTCKAQPKFHKYLLYLSMYFQLIAGPIVRYTDVENEIENRTYSFTAASQGIQRFICGVAKKVIIADVAGEIAKTYVEAPDIATLSVLGAWLGSFMYVIQLYFDFSGYSDMAIGLGKIFGFKLPENFNYPYISKSVSEFWRRWHITLGSFFRDYVYIPLGGNRKKVFLNLFIVWFLTGFWHGASWNYIVWGLYNGFFIILERLFKKGFEKIPAFIRHIYLIVVVNVGFVFFRQSDMTRAVEYVKTMFGFGKGVSDMAHIEIVNNLFFIIIAVILCMPVSRKLKEITDSLAKRSVKHMFLTEMLKKAAVVVLLFVCTAFLAGNSFSAFLYYNF